MIHEDLNEIKKIRAPRSFAPAFLRCGPKILLEYIKSRELLDDYHDGSLAELSVTDYLYKEGEHEIVAHIKNQDGQSGILLDFIEDTEGARAEQVVYENELRSNITLALMSLEARTEKIIRLYFGLRCREHTLLEIGRYFDLTHSRVGRIVLQGLRQLRRPVCRRQYGLVEGGAVI